MRLIVSLILLCPAAWAQDRWEVSFLFGALHAPAVVVAATPTQVSGGAPPSIGWNWQWASAFQLSSADRHRFLWSLEVPITFVHVGSAAGLTRSSNYFTPGVRLKFPAGNRFSFYGAAGGGMAQFGDKDAVINGQLTAAEDTSIAHPAADFGGGADLHLNSFLSLRVDGRDYITPTGFGGTTGRNHALFAAGFVFHR
jgi:hypothetical protein